MSADRRTDEATGRDSEAAPEGGMGGIAGARDGVDDPPATLARKSLGGCDETAAAPRSRYRGLPVVFIAGADGIARPAPFLMSETDVADFFRLADSKTKFPTKTIQRYRQLGLRSVRVGRRRWFTLPDVLEFLDRQQDRVGGDR